MSSTTRRTGLSIRLGWKGRCPFPGETDTRLKITNLIVYRSGYLDIGTEDFPIPWERRVEIVIANKPINESLDPEEFGTGILIFGKVRMHGHALKETFLRFARAPRAGDTKVELVEDPAAMGWRVGDTLLIPDTRGPKGLWIEGDPSPIAGTTKPRPEVKIAAIQGREVTLTRPLNYDHLGPMGATTGKFLPHAVHMPRSIHIKSEYEWTPKTWKEQWNPVLTGTRGHFMCFGRADVDIRFALFKDLGRTRNAVVDSTVYRVNIKDLLDENKRYEVEVAGGVARDVNVVLTKIGTPVVRHGKVIVRPALIPVGGKLIPAIQEGQLVQDGPWQLLRRGTNQIARYAVHMHHVTGPRRNDRSFRGYQFKWIGNCMNGGGFGKWGFVVHGLALRFDSE